ncbi:unnamed protein product, partial [marine sediment metagenome]
MQALAQAILNNVNVYIITSDLHAGSYSSHTDLQYIYNYLLQLTHDKTKLNTFLHLATVSYTNAQKDNIGSHNKFWMVDNKIFYVGSHNIYPSSLQQFGVIIDSKAAAAQINKTLWNPLW